MSQSTAREVRDAITWKYGDKLTRISAMLTAYADMLEAQEKAVPVAWRTFDGEGNYDYRDYENNEHYRDWYVSRNGAKYANWVEPLYSHPAPSDAERLSEALHAFPEDPNPFTYRRCYANARAALAAHSAQAQPPAASVPTMRYFIGGPRACAYVDKFEHVEAVITALCDCTGDNRDDYTSTDLLASERVR